MTSGKCDRAKQDRLKFGSGSWGARGTGGCLHKTPRDGDSAAVLRGRHSTGDATVASTYYLDYGAQTRMSGAGQKGHTRISRKYIRRPRKHRNSMHRRSQHGRSSTECRKMAQIELQPLQRRSSRHDAQTWGVTFTIISTPVRQPTTMQ